ncbi:unnamed protein product [Symbiodinium microadriaticum]|nr:unnamed protein product [Symbiodinium microadriaticum]
MAASSQASKIAGAVATGGIAFGFYWFAKPRFEALLIPTPSAPRKLYSEQDFAASAEFAGSRPGYVYKMDHRGLGYYKDMPASSVTH